MAKRVSPRKKWSARVTRESRALTLDQGVFSQRSPGAIARSLKRSAERSRARKSSQRRKTLETAKGELRRLFGKQKA
jgi:hypothetical protein